MHTLHLAGLVVAATAAFAVGQAQVPQPAAEPGSVPESASVPLRAGQDGLVRPTGPVRISAGVMAGQRIAGDNPVYPPDAKAQGITGAVVLHAIIGKGGTIQSLTVVSGNEQLAEAALNAVKTWVYKPFLLNGEPTDVDTTVTVNFQLPAAPPPGGLR